MTDPNKVTLSQVSGYFQYTTTRPVKALHCILCNKCSWASLEQL